MNDFYPVFETGKFYHIYNRANGEDKLFPRERNYNYFLMKYIRNLSIFINTYCYCLLPNHFHLLIKVRNINKEIHLNDKTKNMDWVSEKFRRLFITHSQAINKQELRIGNLFQKNFKRYELVNMDEIRRHVCLIHINPVYHQISDNYTKYPYGSYKNIFENFNDTEKGKMTRYLFVDIENFMELHEVLLKKLLSEPEKMIHYFPWL